MKVYASMGFNTCPGHLHMISVNKGARWTSMPPWDKRFDGIDGNTVPLP
jgi:hypothetical protein